MNIKKILKLSGFIAVVFSSSGYAAGEGFYVVGQAGLTNTHNQQQVLQIQQLILNPH